MYLVLIQALRQRLGCGRLTITTQTFWWSILSGAGNMSGTSLFACSFHFNIPKQEEGLTGDFVGLPFDPYGWVPHQKLATIEEVHVACRNASQNTNAPGIA